MFSEIEPVNTVLRKPQEHENQDSVLKDRAVKENALLFYEKDKALAAILSSQNLG